ncbi:RHS repeat domain-containing protein, partial [Rhodoferax sp.]|uniref:RHS repeat domain-containing protein n=1 Tax=Rhodoferax sp. TaxID=50421 RepID=UPI002770173E|nr:RHS repeat-associated core domain-containing protein [Rhodoferax sp.]
MIRCNRAQPAHYNANGQPNSVGQREYVWDALGRLLQVRQENQDLAQYRYSHRGERIAKTVAGKTTHYLYHEAGQISAELDEQGRITRQYLYLAEQPIAVIDTPEGVLLSNQELSAPTQLAQDAAFILKNLWRSVSGGGAEQWAWLHPNHLGAPEAATNAQGQVLWQASYAAFGAARVVGFAKASGSPGKTSFTLNLRLPGQYQDSETGLHYNRHRYYDPSRGEYLTPDPLGTPDGPNPYAYVRYNPLKYIDPEGLILFAFDGTNNSNSPPGQDTVSNVYKFYLAYDISPTSANGDRAWYMNGIGRDDPDSGISTNWTDAVNANTGRARVDYMLAQLDDYIDKRDMSDGKIISLDMIGFSRGAA